MSLKYERFLLFGDSITEFAFNTRMSDDGKDEFSLGAALVNAYTRKLDIVQRGFSGFNSRWALKLLPEILKNETNIVMSTIFFGSNDSCYAEQQHVPLPEFEQNIRKLVHMLKEKNIKPIIVGPGLYDNDNWDSRRHDEVAMGYVRDNETFKKYSDVAQNVAAEEGVAFVNLNEAFKRQGGQWPSLLCDGLHFTGKGYEVFFNELMKVIRNHYPEFSPENVPYKLPNWRLVSSDGSMLDKFL